MTKAGTRIIASLTDAIGLSPSLVLFQAESNRIEGIQCVTQAEVEALQTMIDSERLWTNELIAYVSVIQPDARIRDAANVPGVRVGRHIAPPSGPKLVVDLEDLLDRVNNGLITAHDAHCAYETLHPFTDGSGRSGRALWLWMRNGDAPLGFLHQFYYDTLASHESRSA